ncbi:MAG TPA: hypothetical protein VG755_03930 [Nannocystaceae bacterium]|nr:hypothetical protein [Nannocystaceae bacterium]
MTEAELLRKLMQVEALFAGTTWAGEREAAANARDKLRAKLDELSKSDAPVEHKFTLRDTWSVRLLIALFRRYGISPYRRKGQHATTVMAKVPKKFLLETLWPEFEQLSETLAQYLSEVTERVIAEAIHPDRSDAASEPKALAGASS